MNIVLLRTWLGGKLRPISIGTAPLAQRDAEGRDPCAGKALARFDGMSLEDPDGTFQYLVEESGTCVIRCRIVVEQLNRRKSGHAGRSHRRQALLSCAHVRPQQAAVLERGEIDYLDLAATTSASAGFVRSCGRTPAAEGKGDCARPSAQGWIKVVHGHLDPARADERTIPYLRSKRCRPWHACGCINT